MYKMEGSETTFSSSKKICVVCGTNSGKYKFKCCVRSFCSVKCFQIHSREECELNYGQINEHLLSNQDIEEVDRDPELKNDFEETKQFELTEREKQALDNNERLFHLLKENPQLVEMLKFIDRSENKTEALAAVIDEESKGRDALFTEFAELVAESLGEEFRTYKIAYDSIVRDVSHIKR